MTSDGSLSSLVWYDTPRRRTWSEYDPLGLCHIEERIADWFWPGFTSRTCRIGYFVVVSYGLRMAETASVSFGLPRNNDTRRMLFGRFERLWGMSQFVAHNGVLDPEEDMIGLEGFSNLFENVKGAIPTDFLHLQQGEVGALGTYLPSLRAHQWVATDQLRLTPLGFDLSMWMWNDPGSDDKAFDEFVLKSIDPRNASMPRHVGRVGLDSLGGRATLAHLGSRENLRAYLWRRLFEEKPPPQALAVLPRMAEILALFHRGGITQPSDILAALAQQHSRNVEPAIQRVARIALAFANLGKAMLHLFDRVCQTLLAQGYSADWSDCVQAIIDDEVVDQLDQNVASYRELNCNEHIELLSATGRVFAQTMRRFNTQNRYNIFESILNLHTGSQRALGRGDGSIGRMGETVFLRQASTEWSGAEQDRWQPTFRLSSATRLLSELGRLT